MSNEFAKRYANMILTEKLYSNEGRRGVENLAKAVGKLGYTDSQYFGQFQGGSLGTLINFLEDNPGAVEAIHDWIVTTNVEEWNDNLEEYDDEEEG